MNTPRETLYSTLFAMLASAVDGLAFKTISRRVRIWSEVPPEEQPALFMRQVREKAVGERPHPNKWEIDVDVPIYVFAGSGPDDLTAPTLNAAIDRIERLIPTGPPQNRPPGALYKPQTLGLPGVLDVRINGEIMYGEGATSGQGVAVIPIRITAV